MPAAVDRPLYVYALAPPGLPGRFTIFGRRLRTIGFPGIDAIVERGAQVEPSTEAVKRQHSVVTLLSARNPAVLPARFGSVVTAETLGSLLARHRDEVLSAFRRVRGCDQMTVRLFGEPEERTAAESASASGTAYLEQRRTRAHPESAEVALIRRVLGACLRAERVESGRHGVRVTVFHLVPRKRLAAYQRQALVLQQQLREGGATITVTGPWPVFAFAPELF